jgi:CBS domain-containing protein
MTTDVQAGGAPGGKSLLGRVTEALRAAVALARPRARALQARAQRGWADARARSGLKVAELMVRDVELCRPEETLASAASKMWNRDVGHLPVVAHDGRVVGAITDRDICMAAYLHGRGLAEIPVSIAMSRDLHACAPEATIADAEEIMRKRQLRRLPVIDSGGALVGVISLNDLARAADRRSAKRGREVTAREVTVTLAAIGEPRGTRVLASI